jgi:hypothetical protein
MILVEDVACLADAGGWIAKGAVAASNAVSVNCFREATPRPIPDTLGPAKIAELVLAGAGTPFPHDNFPPWAIGTSHGAVVPSLGFIIAAARSVKAFIRPAEVPVISSSDIGATLGNAWSRITENIIGAGNALPSHVHRRIAPRNSIDDMGRIGHAAEAVLLSAWHKILRSSIRHGHDRSAKGEAGGNERTEHGLPQ